MSVKPSRQLDLASSQSNEIITPVPASKMTLIVGSRPQQWPNHLNQSPGPDSDASSTVKRRGRPRKLPNTISGASLPVHGGRPQSASREASSVPGIPKRRGRPPTKNKEHAENQVKNKRGRRTTQKNEDGVPRKRGRPPSKPQKPMTLQLPEPKYIPFICEWQDCSAELQNLDTLRRHISVVHGKAQDSGLYSCLWGKCGKQLAQIQGGSYEALMKANEFWTEQDWREHVNEAHLIPFAWHMGDGPKGTTFGKT